MVEAIITDELIEPMMQIVIAGGSATDCVNWLKEKHNIIVSNRAVNQRLKKFKDLEKQVRLDVIAQEAGKDALYCIQLMDRNIAVLHAEGLKLMMSDKIADKLAGKQLADSLLKFINSKMGITGINLNNTEEVNTDDVISGLLTKLGRPADEPKD